MVFRKMIKSLFSFLSSYFSIAHFNSNHDEFKKIYPDDFAVIFNSTYSNQINTFGLYNKELNEKILQIINKNNLNKNTFLDIGANIGDVSLYFSKVFNSVICFEPHPKIFKILEFNSENLSNIEIFNFGVAENKSKLYQSKIFHNNFTAPAKKIKSENNYEIAAVNIDEFLDNKNLDLINFINITVDGSELDVLKGMKKLLKKNNVELLMVEADNLERIIKLSEYLKQNDFKFIYLYKKSLELKKKNFIKIFLEKFSNKEKLIKINLEANFENKINFGFNKNILFSKKELF